MSQTITETEQLELVNIVTISQSKLVNNFEILLRQLRQTNQRIDQIQKKISENTQHVEHNFDEIRQQGHESQAQIIQLHTEIGTVSNNLTSLSTDVAVKSGQHNMKIVDIQLTNKQLHTKIDAVDRGLTMNIQGVINQQLQMKDVIKANYMKQGLNMEKISKEVQMLVMKNQNNLKKQKVVQQRIVTLQKQMSGEESVRLQDIIVDKIMRQVRKSPITSTNHRENSKTHISKKDVKINQKQNEELSQKQSLKSEKIISGNKISVKALDAARQSVRQSQINNDSYNPNDFLGIAEMKSSINLLKNKMKSLQLANNEPLSILIDDIRKQITSVKNFGNQSKKDIQKLKTDSSAITLTQKIQELRPQLNKIWGVIAGVEDKNIFLQRKLDQMKKVLSEVTSYVKQNNVSRYDQKIRMIQSDLFSKIKQIGSKLDLKTNNSDFIKQSNQIDDNFRQIRAMIATKCQKIQVKKALLFIESKIKQIILVISEDQQYQKDALLTKKQIKCVSCDKQLDKQNGLVNSEPRNWNMMPQKQMQPQSYGKCGISRFGSLATRIRKLEGSNQLPLLKSKAKDKQNNKQFKQSN